MTRARAAALRAVFASCIALAAACSDNPCDDPLATLVCTEESCPGVQPPEAIEKPGPDYPTVPYQAGIQGVVLLQGVVDCRGRLTDLQVLESPDPSLSDESVRTLATWSFVPARYQDSVVSMRVKLQMSFSII
jgi:TonB family protein